MDCQSFAKDKELEIITIPEGVTRIPENTFDQCSRLRKVVLPQSLEEICDMAFSGCMALEKISIPAKVNSIGPQAFTYCMTLREIEVSEDNMAYSSYNGALYDKNRSVLVKYPAGLTGKAVLVEDLFEIGEWAFEWSTAERIVIPEGVTKIGSRAFSGSIRATEIILPETVTRIGDQAFFGCHRLTELTIPEGVMIIERSAFYNCMSLEKLYMPNSVASLDSWVFDGCPNLTVYCPEDSYTWEYCEATGVPHEAWNLI
ncbi:MAG: leucine-rich repeat domain-containing protein [Saccharofermentanales bacterium]|jgi:hypothetical protein